MRCAEGGVVRPVVRMSHDGKGLLENIHNCVDPKVSITFDKDGQEETHQLCLCLVRPESKGIRFMGCLYGLKMRICGLLSSSPDQPSWCSVWPRSV